jgi:hypothetical protein
MGFGMTIARHGISLNMAADKFADILMPNYIEKVSEFAFDEMYKNAPWRSGYLAMSITKEISGNQARVYPTAPYATIVARGSRPHLIRSVTARSLAFQVGIGGLVFARLVNHPGTRANPFIQLTAQETRDEQGRFFMEAWNELMDECTR